MSTTKSFCNEVAASLPQFDPVALIAVIQGVIDILATLKCGKRKELIPRLKSVAQGKEVKLGDRAFVLRAIRRSMDDHDFKGKPTEIMAAFLAHVKTHSVDELEAIADEQ